MVEQSILPTNIKKYTLLLALFLLLGESYAQHAFPGLSPKGRIEQRVGTTDISIDYERPAARGRKVFGSLVSYGEIWRTGAGNCTKIHFSKQVEIANKKINAGSYSLFTIPGKTEWTVILNSDTSLYGTSSYDKQKDLIRFTVKSTTTDRYFESVTIDLDIVPNNAVVYISWERTQISFPIETESDKMATDFINKQLLTNLSNNPEDYANAAEYHYYFGKDMELALVLINKAIQQKNEAWYYRQKVDILEKLNKYKEAIECAELAISLNQQRSDWDEASKETSKKEYEQRIRHFKSKLAEQK